MIVELEVLAQKGLLIVSSPEALRSLIALIYLFKINRNVMIIEFRSTARREREESGNMSTFDQG